MINPYTCYVLGFIVSLVVYQFGWSEVYPKLSVPLLIFLAATIFAHAALARIWKKKEDGNKLKKGTQNIVRINPWLITGFLYFLWSIDFLYEGGVPLFKMIWNIPFDYKKFGAPGFHVLAVSFGSFYCVYLFQYFLKNKDKQLFLLFAINMAAAILITSRAMLFFNLASCFFLYLLHLDRIPYKKLLLGFPLVIFLFYLFGVIGTNRVSFESKTSYNHELFLDKGKATLEFRKSAVPKEFFWSYFYISSPLANLQVNINTYVVKPITTKRILEYINNELILESISKRINALVGIKREGENVIKDPFNVSTVYSRSYSYLGWTGMIFTAIVMLSLPMLYKQLLSDNLNQIGVAILCTTFLFMSYDNTIRLMGLGFQLIYPVVFPIIERRILFISGRRQ